jgi:hypothetical protein
VGAPDWAAPRRGTLVVGAVLTVLFTVGLDLSAGEAPLHAATLGLVAALAAFIRVQLAGRHRSLLQFVCGCIISQPALHFGIKYMPHADIEHGVGMVPGAADLIAVSAQILLILALAVGVTIIEQIIVALVMGATGFCLVRIRPIRVPDEPGAAAVGIAPACELWTSKYLPGSIARRGPPPRALRGLS